MSEITPLQPPAEPPPEQPLRGHEGVAALLRKAAAEQRQPDAAKTAAPEPESEDLPQVDLDNAGVHGGEPATDGEIPENADTPTPASDSEGEISDDEPLGTLAMDGLAERAGLTLEELFNVELPLGDERDPVTLGALKDRFTELARVDDSRNLLEEQRTTFENDMIRSRQELNAIVQLLPEVPPQIIQAATAAFQANLDREREALRAVKPEWRDPETFRAAQDEMLETVEVYGFNRTDLDRVLDHRIVKLVHDFGQLQKKFKAATAQAKEVTNGKTFPTPTARQSKAAGNKRRRQEILKRARDGNTQDKVAGVASLLRGD